MCFQITDTTSDALKKGAICVFIVDQNYSS